MRNTILIFSAILLFATACNESGTKSKGESNSKEKSKTDNKNKNEDKEGDVGYSISAPHGWEKTTQTEMGHVFTLLRSPRQNANDPFMENVNVVYEKTGSASLEDYINGSLSQLDRLNGFVNKGISYRTINGIRFGVVDYSHEYSGVPIDVRLFVTVNDGTGYVITCSAQGGEFSGWESTFEETIRTFEMH